MRVKLSESHASRVNDDAPVESDAPVLLSKISTSSIQPDAPVSRLSLRC
jgi:hypothetical protein